MLKDLFERLAEHLRRKSGVAVVITNPEDDEKFNRVLDEVKYYEVDRLEEGDVVVYALNMSDHRYYMMIDICKHKDIPLACYSTTGYLHRIVK